MSDAGPIRIHPDNPHYLIYHGKPIVPIASAEHYGALINGAFDYNAYFDALARYGLDYTRIYPGAYFEIEGMFIEDNTLAPRPDDLILPWARGDQAGFALGGNKFDLERWDEAYFARLRDFLAQAQRRGIIVEICFFNCQYPQSWYAMAINAANNVQNIGQCHYNDVQTLADAALVRALERYVGKIVLESNPYDNVIFEICDEPSLYGTSSAAASRWIGRMADVIIETERSLKNKHLIAQQLEIGVDFTEDARVALITTQYMRNSTTRQIGGPEALDCLYTRDKPIELNETAFYPIWYETDRIAASRVEAWEFIGGGGAAFNQLNGLYTAENPSGDAPENHAILKQLQALKRFIGGLDIAAMRRDTRLIKHGAPDGAIWRAISAPGAQWALYIHHGRMMPGGRAYLVEPGCHRAALSLDLPAGEYAAAWIEPATGRTLRADRFTSDGSAELQTPEYSVDIALRIDRHCY